MLLEHKPFDGATLGIDCLKTFLQIWVATHNAHEWLCTEGPAWDTEDSEFFGYYASGPMCAVGFWVMAGILSHRSLANRLTPQRKGWKQEILVLVKWILHRVGRLWPTLAVLAIPAFALSFHLPSLLPPCSPWTLLGQLTFLDGPIPGDFLARHLGVSSGE